MGLPDMNPLAAKLMGGVDYRKQLQQQLLDAAEATDDPAYRDRLLEVANGDRPLRALASDPAFAAKHRFSEEALSEAVESMERAPGSSEERREELKAQLAKMGMSIPSPEELAGIFSEVTRLRDRTDSIVRADELTGWGGTIERLNESGEAASES